MTSPSEICVPAIRPAMNVIAPVIARIVTATTAATMKEPTTQLRLITRRAYGFRTPEALIALALLSLGGL